MKISQKIAFFSLIAAFTLFTSGLCTFPMAASASTHGMLGGMNMNVGAGDNNTLNVHQVAGGCSTCASDQNNLNACSLSCGNSISKTAVVKKVGISFDFPVSIEQSDFVSSLDLNESDLSDSSPPHVSFITEALLSVSKKE